MAKIKKIGFAGWGTGGHVMPIRSLLEQRDEAQCECFRFGEKNSLEERMCPTGVQFVAIEAGKMRREGTRRSRMKNFWDIAKFGKGVRQSLTALREYGIEVIFCKGWYVALPVVLAAKILGIRIVMHESDTVAGLTNKVAAKLADKKFAGFPGVVKGAEVVGQILSEELLVAPVKPLRRTQVLVMGGSQGARTIFLAIVTLLQQGKLKGFDFHVMLGTKNSDERELLEAFPNVTCYGFVTQSQLAQVYSVCDVSVTRGSATSIEEQLLFGLKLIIVPLPYTGGNHQYYNALHYHRTHDATVLDQQQPDFVRSLENAIEAQKAFKKTPQDPKAQKKWIDAPKQKIWKALLAS